MGRFLEAMADTCKIGSEHDGAGGIHMAGNILDG